MRRAIFALLLILATPAFADDGWFAYNFPADPSKAPAYNGAPSSLFNAGAEVLDPPAGRHGFTAAADAHFFFADGTRARFWGTNLCFDACFPEHRQAELLAGRLAYFGFNAVRLHHMDYYFEPRGIFEDIAPAHKERQLKPTGSLSPRQLDKLDYLIFQLKQRGIYINMNTLVSRQFTEADGVPDAAKFGIAAKPVSLFDERLIALQKQYDHDLLTHLNPYTKLRYCDDPAICMVEITNENTLTDLKPSTLPDYYRKEYNVLFDMWLAATGQKIDAAPRPNLLPGIDSWGMEQHSGAVMSEAIEAAPDITGRPVAQAAILTVKNITPTAWHLQFHCTGIHLAKGKNYLFKFRARSESPTAIGAVTQQAYAPWNNLGLSENVRLTGAYQTFEFPFTAADDCDNAKVGFITGYAPGSISIKDVSLSENPTAGFIKEFNAYLEGKYLGEMRAFLRDEVGVKCPIGIGGHWDPAQSKLQADELDYIDHHAYWDHPRFPNKAWDNSDFRIQNKSILSDPNQGIISSVIARSPDDSVGATKQSPHTLTEWNHCYPNQYAYETPLLLAQAARQNDWDALFQFDFCGGARDLENYNNINGYFDINPNAQQLILCSFASRIFLGPVIASPTPSVIASPTPSVIARSEATKQSPTFSITPDCAVITFGGYTIKVGPIKNTDSGWSSDGRFSWGSAPALLQIPD